MPRPNARGQWLSGVAGVPASVDGFPVTVLVNGQPEPMLGGAQWITDDDVIGQVCVGEGCTLQRVTVATGATVEIAHEGANVLAAGGGRYAAWHNGVVYGDIGAPSGAYVYDSAASPDGTIGWKRVYQSDGGLTLSAADGSVVDVPDADPIDVQVIKAGVAIWQDIHQGIGVLGRAKPRPAVPVGRLRLVTVDGEDWLIAWSDGIGLFAQVDGAADGYILEPRPVAFNHEAVVVDGEIIVGWCITEGEALGELRTVTIDRTAPRVTLVKPPSVAPYDRPFWCGYFYSYSDKYGDNPSAPGNCAIVVEPDAARTCPLPVIIPPEMMASAASRWASVVAIYVASGNPDALSGGVALARQLMAAAGLSMRPILAFLDGWPPYVTTEAEIVGVELYCDPAESLAAFVARASAGLASLGALPPSKSLALIVEAYDRNGAEQDEAKLLALQALWPELARSPRTFGTLFFSDGRSGGTRNHEDLRPWHRTMVAAIPGTPAIVTIPPAPAPDPVPQPKPKPTPAPTPAPVPSTPFPPAHSLGGSMRVYLKKAGKYTGINPTPVAGKSGDAQFPVYADRPAGGAWEEIDLEPVGNGFTATYVAANRELSIQPDGSLQSRAAKTDGGYEVNQAVTEPDNLSVFYRDDSGQILGTPLTIEEIQ